MLPVLPVLPARAARSLHKAPGRITCVAESPTARKKRVPLRPYLMSDAIKVNQGPSGRTKRAPLRAYWRSRLMVESVFL